MTEMVEFFEKMGRIGGKISASKMTPEERKARAKKAADAATKARKKKARERKRAAKGV